MTDTHDCDRWALSLATEVGSNAASRRTGNCYEQLMQGSKQVTRAGNNNNNNTNNRLMAFGPGLPG